VAKPGSLNKHGRIRKKPGPLSEQDKRIAISLKAVSPHLAATTIAKGLNRSTRSVASYLLEARDMLLTSAPLVAGHMLQASAVASAKGDSRPSEWILGRISSVDEAGKVVRVVEQERAEASTAGLTVNIGLQIGNIPGADTHPSTIPLLPLEGTVVAVSDSIIKS
jgi:hypothetical protein